MTILNSLIFRYNVHNIIFYSMNIVFDISYLLIILLNNTKYLKIKYY